MHRPSHPSLAFLAPGLLHQLGNQLFSLQGNAQLLPDDDEGLRARLLSAVTRGSETLRVLRALVGDPMAPQLALDAALQPLLELARVSLREMGHQIDWLLVPNRSAAPVDAGTVVEFTAAALSAVLDVVPSGTTGTFAVRGESSITDAVVAVSFEPAVGSLPFPLAMGEVRERLERVPSSGPSRPCCRALAAGIELMFPRASRLLAGEA